mmetsp:Transcript_130700/g.378121  ORF Transcript_130700/g.378121 Transcript_130700/m.378121 type:complete len:243 (-) Transcript_130700:327-1055(-)
MVCTSAAKVAHEGEEEKQGRPGQLPLQRGGDRGGCDLSLHLYSSCYRGGEAHRGRLQQQDRAKARRRRSSIEETRQGLNVPLLLRGHRPCARRAFKTGAGHGQVSLPCAELRSGPAGVLHAPGRFEQRHCLCPRHRGHGQRRRHDLPGAVGELPESAGPLTILDEEQVAAGEGVAVVQLHLRGRHAKVWLRILGAAACGLRAGVRRHLEVWPGVFAGRGRLAPHLRRDDLHTGRAHSERRAR